ncbi:MAG: putative porin [Balneolaceae bacterium]
MALSLQIQDPDTVRMPPDTLTLPSDTIQVTAPTVTKTDASQQAGQEGEEDEEDELEIVPMWLNPDIPAYETVETDSTLRWFMALDRTERLAQNPGVIIYRTGSLGRPTGLDIYSFENRHQELELYDLSANDPVTGQVNWNRVPYHKIKSIEAADWAATYSSSIQLREHYLIQPRTYLNFDESQENYRSLEFSFTHNVMARTNLELSYWDRKDGMIYPRSNMEGNQILARVRHHVTDKLLLKTGYISNSIEQEQPFGYNIQDLGTYLFNPFNAVPLETSASSSQGANDFYVQFHQRKDTLSPAFRMAGIYHQKDEWEMNFSQDTTRYSVSESGLQGWQTMTAGNTRFRATGRVGVLRDHANESLRDQAWIRWNGKVVAEYPFMERMDLGLSAGYQGRSDGQTGYDLSGQLNIRLTKGFYIKPYGGFSSSIPDLQALYWDSEQVSGDSGLGNETGLRAGMTTEVDLSSDLSFGGRIEGRRVEKGIFSDETGNFVNIDPYMNLAASAWLTLDSQILEGDLSISSQSFNSGSAQDVNRNLDLSGDKIWIRGSFYWKNYVFDQAAFVKAGISGMFTPGNYLAAGYLPPLNRWQHGTSTQYIPSFYRLDVNISARIRWMMVHVRWENVLDRLGQAGYFETAGYPMPPRRFIFGIRVLFTN